MAKSLFLIKGNICAERVRLGRALQKPPMTQDDLARKIQFMGMDMTPLIISRIEKNQRHVCDYMFFVRMRLVGHNVRVGTARGPFEKSGPGKENVHCGKHSRIRSRFS